MWGTRPCPILDQVTSAWLSAESQNNNATQVLVAIRLA